MVTNITMLVRDRSMLTKQAIESLYANTPRDLFNLTVLDDASQYGARWVLDDLRLYNTVIIRNEESKGTGVARNQVIEEARISSLPGWHGDYLYLSDNDVYFYPKWLQALIECYEYAREQHGVIALGAYNHPYNGPFEKHPFYSTHLGYTVEIGLVYALATQSWLWQWEDWDKYGSFKATTPGRVCDSEDWEMSQRIRNDGKQVASVYPPLLVNCGRTNSFGQPIPGAELIPDVEGVLVL